MDKIYKINEFANRIGKSTSTLRRWDREGQLVAKRTPTGQRYYNESDIRKILGIKDIERKIIVYCRVSSSGQKDDLKSQLLAMERFCIGGGIAVDEWMQEIGGGMNFKRKQFLNLILRVISGEIQKVIVAHKDRLCRFGFDFFEYLANQNQCEILVVNQQSLSPQQEMVEDLMTIIHTFSCRLYGLRKYRNDLKKIVETNEDNPNTL